MPSSARSREPLNRSDEGTIRDLCDLLGLRPSSPPERVTIGQSGALVVRIMVGGEPVVLKVTRDSGRLERARAELRLIADRPEGLDGALPRFVAGHHDDTQVCLVTRYHQPLPPPSQLADADWSNLATALGALHRTIPPSWWTAPPPAANPTPAQISESVGAWALLGYHNQAERAADIITDVDAQTFTAAVPTAFCHGDCHTENAVLDHNRTVRWIDWQDARPGDGLSDLVFLWQRAEFAEARPPRKHMLTTYQAARKLAAGTPLQPLLDRAELKILLTQWPHHLSNGSANAQELMKARLPDLVNSLS